MIINTLKHQLSEEEFRIVIRSLRQDTIIWSALQDTQLLQKIQYKKLKGLNHWTPANIALTHIHREYDADLLSGATGSLDPETLTKASDMLESLLSPLQNVETDDQLAQAAYAALALRERWLLLDAVEGTFFDLIQEDSILWKTILSILFGMIPNREKILAFLLLSSEHNRHELAIHLISSQPMSISAQSRVLVSSLQRLSPLQRSVIMQTLQDRHPTLAKQIAADLLETLPEIDPNRADTVQNLISLMERTELLKVHGQYQEVLPALDQIRKLSTNLQADLTAQLAQAAARDNDQITAKEAIQKVTELERDLNLDKNQNIALAHINTGTLDASQIEPDRYELETKPEKSLSLLLTAIRAASHQGENEKAQQFAQQAYQDAISLFNLGRTSREGSPSLSPSLLQTLTDLLLSVDMIEEAVEIGRLSQEKFPNNQRVIRSYAAAMHQLGKYDQAVEYYNIALALAENSPEIFRELIETLMTKQDWIEARKETEKLILSLSTPLPEDYLYLATCYLNTDQPNDAINSCQQGLLLEPENWALLRLLGKVHQQLNDYSEAQKYFSQAIVHHPEKINTWLELSELHQQYNEYDKALEGLISATNVNPENADLHLRLGMLYQQKGDPIKSLAAFNQAARFITDDTLPETRKQIAVNLGKTLLDGGYVDEAITVFEKAHRDYPADSKIAYQFAKALLQEGSFEKAYPILTLVLKIPGAPIDAHLDYAEVILKLSKSPELALEHIQVGLDQDPKHERARILLAKATAASDNHTAALELYQEALQTELSRQPEYFVALTVGIARSAFKTEQTHLAITFLKEGLRQFQDSLELKKTLCQAYIHTNLKPDALEILEEIRSGSDNSLEELIWIADQAIALKELDLATTILNEASQIAPNNSEVIVRLGYAQLENGKEDTARKTFSQLFEVEEVDISDMKLAAHALVGMGDVSTSIPFIEKALELCDYQSGDLLSELTQLYLQAEQFSLASEAVQKHLDLTPEDPDIWITYSQILIDLGRPRAAIKAVKKAINLTPASAALHSQAAAMFRQENDLTASLEHIRQAVELNPENKSILSLAVRIFRTSLLDDKAYELITSIPTEEIENLPLLISRSELLITQQTIESFSLANQSIHQALKISPINPRAMAVKARLLQEDGQHTEAEELFDQAYQHFASDEFSETDRFSQSETLLSIGEAALTMGYWDHALKIGEQAVALTPHEPRPHHFIAKANTLRAEFQNTCNAIKAQTHAPGKQALGEEAKEAFQKAIASLYELAPTSDQAGRILRWEQRGQYALMNQAPFKNPALNSPEDFAALIAASIRKEEQIDLETVPEEWLNHAEVRFQLSLAYSISDIHNALEIAADLAHHFPYNPVYLAHYALLAYRSNDLFTALTTINKAMQIWSEEPNWHVFAASLESEKKNYSKAIDHLEKACCIEDDVPDYLFQLGSAYLNGGLPGNAIRVLEEVVNIHPLEPEYWAALSQAYMNAEEIDQASAAIEKAANLEPKSVRYRMMAAGIAHNKGSEAKRDAFIQQAIDLQPRDPADIISLTNLLIDQDRSEEAMQILDDLIDLSTAPIQLLLQKAAILRKTRGVHEEIKMLVDLVKKDPRNPFTLARLCESYLKVNQPQDAIKAGQFAIKHGKNVLSTSRLSKLNYQVGILFRRSGQLDQAVSYLSKSIKLTPHFIDAYLEMGKTLKARREFDKALNYLDRAISIAPQDPRPYLNAGLLLKEGTDYLGAEAMLKQAAALAPNDVNIKRQLAAVIAMAIIHQNESH